jgi:hypothetical protein
MMKAAIQNHPAMLRHNHMAGCLPCQNGTAKYRQTSGRCKGTGAPPPNRRRQPTAEPTVEPTAVPTTVPMPPVPGTPPCSTGNNARARNSEIINWQVNMPINIHLVPVITLTLSINLPRIASTIQIVNLIC